MTKKKAGIIGSTILLLLLILILGPLDCFRHGYYCDEISYDMLEQDLQKPINLKNVTYEMSFSPVKRHMVGVEINLTNQPEKNKGKLKLTVLDEKERVIDTVSVNLKKVTENEWYKVKLKKELKKEKVYTLRFDAEDCKTTPSLQTVTSDYLSPETKSGNVLLGYAYAQPTFTLQNKVLIVLFFVSIWLWICMKLLNRKDGLLPVVPVVIFLSVILSWNYMYNSMDNKNTTFQDFQVVSENLVTGVIRAEHEGIWYKKDSRYGLGNYETKLTEYTNGDWISNYAKEENAVIVDLNSYSKKYAQKGNYIAFPNDQILKITRTEDQDQWRILYIESKEKLNPYKYGKLSEAQYCNEKRELLAPLEKKQLKEYKSQYGLQGKVFRHLARYLNYEDAIETLHLLCSMAAAIVFSVIVILLSLKYDKVLAGIFFVVFWLSPWVVNFANNLYWVEFTWFIPMAVGLFCSIKFESRKCRIVSYVLTFISVLMKCLCGYEYISVIMMALISFMLIDFVKVIICKNKTIAKRLFWTIIVIGFAALLGFAVAICIHAQLRGDGNLIEGIKHIFREDVLRRTNGADLNDFEAVYWPSFNASVWDTFRQYFHFSTEVVLGIDGNWFAILCILPLCIFAHDIKQKKANVEQMAMYAVFFLTSISWFCLAKGHSFIHTHMNYVLWYFGFVQVCFYVIVQKIRVVLKKI